MLMIYINKKKKRNNDRNCDRSIELLVEYFV